MSLRRRVTTAGALVVLVAVATFGAVTVRRTHDALLRRTDQELAALASGLATYAENQAEKLEAGRPVLRYRRLQRLQLPETFSGYSVVVAPDGRTAPLPRLAREGTDVPRLPTGLADRAGHGPFELDGGYRALVVDIPGHDSVTFVALALSNVEQTTAELLRFQVVAGGLVVGACSVLLLFTVRLGLRPLGAVTAAARRQASSAQASPLTAGAPGTEVGELTDALNEMLARIRQSLGEREEAKQRTERFAADAAHELRTPVTVILGYAELYQHGGVEGRARLDEVFDRIHAEAERLRHLVDGLLVLNRLDQPGRGGPAAEPIELGELCAAAAADSMAVDGDHPITVEVEQPAIALARRDEVVQILSNLLTNVRTHTPPGTAAVISLRPGHHPGSVLLEVADDGPGIQAAHRDEVFERFHRAAGGGQGQGLGLAIVRALARRNGGDASLDDDDDDGPGTTVRVRLLPGTSVGGEARLTFQEHPAPE